MRSFDFFKRKKKTSGKTGPAQDTTGAPFSVTKVRPSVRQRVGTVISFCIDSHSIQMAAIRHLGKSRRLVDIRKEYFPRDRTDRKARNDIILREVGDFTSRNAGIGSSITVTVSGPETAFRTFLMPKLKKADLDSAIRFEVKKQIPFPLEDCTYDYRPIYSIRQADSARYKIALQAATSRFIREQMEPFETLGLQVSYVYHTQDVIGEFLNHLPGFSEDKNYTLLNIGLRSTEISFYKGTTLEFSHATSVSSAMLGSYPEATRYEYFAELISNEIQTSLDYYAGQYSVSIQDKIFVYGDMAYSQELLDLLNDKSGIALEPLPVDKLSHLTPKTKEQTEVFPVCLPVLAGAACQSALANLLPLEQKAARKEFTITTYGKAAILVLMLAMAWSWVMFRNKLEIADHKLIELNRQVVEFRHSEAFHTYNLVKRQIALDQAYLDQIKESPSYLALNLKELSHLTPDEVKFVYLEYKPDPVDQNFYIHGLVESVNIPPELILAEYVEDLSASPFYDNVTIIRHVKKTIEGKFQIDFQIRMRGVV